MEYFFNKKRTQLNVNTPNSRVNDIKQSAKSGSQRLGFDKADGGVKDRNPSISVNPVVKGDIKILLLHLLLADFMIE